MTNGSGTQAPADALLMMTLAGLAACSGIASDTLADQESYILDNLNGQLADTALATGGTWKAVWVGLSTDFANLAYIAQDTAAATPTYAVAIRGTVAGNPVDLSEDIDVTSVAGFWSSIRQKKPLALCADTSAVCISAGASQAFTEVTGATFTDGTTLEQTLVNFATAAGPTPITIYVTGHSLGGATATTVALHLALGVTWPTTPVFQVYTFAGPTAGMAAFASLFNDTFGGGARGTNSSWQVVNAFDGVPTAWVTASMEAMQQWYAGGPEASECTCIAQLIKDAPAKAGVHTYVQPSVNPVALNADQATMDPNHRESTDLDFTAQALFQHGNNTYISLLAAGTSPTPWVTPVPGAPGALAAVAGGTMLCSGAPDTYQITLYWTPPAPDASSVLGSPSGAPESYQILRSTTSGSGYEALGQVGGQATSFVDMGLPPETTYYYVVQAINPSGASAASKQVSATTGKPAF